MNHINRTQRAVKYIEDRLTAPIAIDELALEVGFSNWHFQRVFRAVVGDAVKEYIRKRRLSEAMRRLRSSQKLRILDVALEYQFESHEAFTRAFKNQFGVTPARARQQNNLLLMEKVMVTEARLKHLFGGMTMEPSIATIKEIKLVGLTAKFISIHSPKRNNFVVIPELWKRYMAVSDAIPNRVGWADYGLVEIPDGVAAKEWKEDDELLYMAAAEVSSFDGVGPEMATCTVPAGLMATFIHRGTLDKLGHTMDYIYASWLPKSEYRRRSGPELEFYGPRFKLNAPESELEIMIPVKKGK